MPYSAGKHHFFAPTKSHQTPQGVLGGRRPKGRPPQPLIRLPWVGESKIRPKQIPTITAARSIHRPEMPTRQHHRHCVGRASSDRGRSYRP